jgi:hypothetical protein
MSATVHALGRLTPSPPPMPRLARTQIGPVANDSGWLVDVLSLARCRELLAGRPLDAATPRTAYQALLDVPLAYDQFCRNHFTSVQRLHPELQWPDACQAYAIALSAHALLCDVLGDGHEALLAQHWDSLRGDSNLDWRQARPLVADGCSALARLDPLAMRR